MRRLTMGLFISLLAAGLGLAQTAEDSWDNLSILRVGEKIQVVDQKLKSLTGTFVGVTEEAISLQVGEAPVTVQRVDVLRVTSRERTQRRRNALIGLAIGAAAGAVGQVIWLERATTGPVYYGGEGAAQIAAAAILGGGIGAGIGAAFPSHRTIYRAKKQP